MLEDEIYCNNIESIIQTTCNNNIHLEDDLLWDLCKLKFKEFSIKYAIAVSRNKKHKISQIESDIEYCETRLNMSNIDDREHLSNLQS